jgi:hypothetical protein
MTEKKDAAEALRQGAAKLRSITAEADSKLSADLLRLAKELEAEAAEVEGRGDRKWRSSGDGVMA